MNYFTRNILFISALFTAGLALIFYLTDSNTGSGVAFPGILQERVREEIKTAEADMERVLTQVRKEKSFSFGSTYTKSKFPYFLFKNGKLAIWSDNKIAADYQLLSSFDPPQMITLPQGKFIVLRNSFTRNGEEFTLFCLINLFRHFENENNYLRSVYNPELFTITPLSIGTEFTTGQQIVRDANGRALFSVKFQNSIVNITRHIPYQTLFLGFVSIILWGVFVIRKVIRLQSRHRYGLGLLWLVCYLILLRALMVRYAIPFAFCGNEIFNPEFFHFSRIAPSLGDLLLNVLSLIWVLYYISSIYYRTVTYRWLINWPSQMKIVASGMFILTSYAFFAGFFHRLTELYDKAGFSLDITLSIHFGLAKIIWLFTYIALCSAYFLLTHLLMSLFNRLNSGLLSGVAIIGSVTLLSGFIILVVGIPLQWIFLLHTVYVLIVYLSKITKAYYGFRYLTTIYYFISALICSSVATYIGYNHEFEKDLISKRSYAKQLLDDNDPYTEFLIQRATQSISSDVTLAKILKEPSPLTRDLITDRIKTNYFNPYLDFYGLEVVVFDSAGRSTESPEGALDKESYLLKAEKAGTSLKNLPDSFRLKPSSSHAPKKYISYTELHQADSLIGSIAFELEIPITRTEADKPSGRFYPGKEFIQRPETRQYSFGIFRSDFLLSSGGPYNYIKNFPARLLKNPLLFTEGIFHNGYHHIGQLTSDSREIIVSSEAWKGKGILANLSFMYLVLVIFIALIIFAQALRYGLKGNNLTYTTKIQVMLNATFILPFLLMLLIIIRVIYSNYQENQENNYLTTAHNLAINISSYLDGYTQSKMSKGYIEQEIGKIGKDAGLNINVYDASGNIFLSSSPLITESGLIASHINPEAYHRIVGQKDYHVILPESLGQKDYKSAYIGIGLKKQGFRGIVGVSFYDADNELKQGIIEIVASVLIIFASLFILFLVVSYLGANLLVKPLKVLTKKIGSTNLYQLEPISWKSKDEIGLLIRQYNQMLLNLQENRQALSTSEKQSAWREMAKQVAHEIKNPLTPMKLTLQQLQRTLRRDDPNSLEKMSKAMHSIIEQIDNIGHIAQSFSDIANMPLPVSELFEITSVLYSSSELYANDSAILLIRSIEPGPIYIKGDRQQFGACITNLIINGIQSVPDFRKVEIDIRLYRKDENVLIEISDNGSGIPREIGNRVFLPNFTTKEGGSGFGLALAKRIIEHAGGSIWFETEEGFGSTFYLSVPTIKNNP